MNDDPDSVEGHFVDVKEGILSSKWTEYNNKKKNETISKPGTYNSSTWDGIWQVNAVALNESLAKKTTGRGKIGYSCLKTHQM